MSTTARLRCTGALMMSLSMAACSGDEKDAVRPAAAAPAESPQTPAPAGTADACPLTIEQVAAVTGATMTRPPGGCTFFPANGRDVPHVFYVLQVPMVCNSIQPGDVGFTERAEGLPGRAYVKDAIDGSHVLVCRDGGARAFDIVVDIKNDKPANRAAAIALAKQVLASR